MTPRRVLIVDDDDSIREIAAVSLEVVGGHEVLTARSGEDALALLAAQGVDVILLDVMMPRLDGPSTVTRLKADPATRGIPVVMLTAKAQTREKADLSALPGVAGVIAKPFDPMALPGLLAQILGWEAPA